MFYEKHIFVCANQKPDGKKCCGQEGGLQAQQFMRQRLADLGFHGKGKVRVSSSGCLGRCGEGPVLVIYPEAHWYRYESEEDLLRILEKDVLGGGLAEGLSIPEAL